MDVNNISTKYKVRKLNSADTEKILALFAGNPLYFEYCPPLPTAETVEMDMKALPPKMTYDDKFYVGFFEDEKLAAVLDLILRYPNDETAFIGLFIVAEEYQGKGTGTSIISELESCLWESGFKYIRLGYVKGNPQANAFWKKNKFAETGTENVRKNYTVITMQKVIG